MNIKAGPITFGVVAAVIAGGVAIAPIASAEEMSHMVIFSCADVAKGAPRVMEKMPPAYTDKYPGKYTLSVWSQDGNTLLDVLVTVTYSSSMHGDMATNGPDSGRTLVYKAGLGSPYNSDFNKGLLDSMPVTGC